MAKEQDLSLTPSTISGVCGRLKCCLKYEHEGYLEMEKTMPRRGDCCECAEGRGRVVDRNLLTQKVAVCLEESGRTIVCDRADVTVVYPEKHKYSKKSGNSGSGQNGEKLRWTGVLRKMKAGDSIRCPHCGADSFLKKESVMEGWTKVGEVLKCASCSAVIADAAAPEPETEKASRAAERLKRFLGAEETESIHLSLDEADRRFCKDCVNLIRHPFVLRCALDGRAVNRWTTATDSSPADRSRSPFPNSFRHFLIGGGNAGMMRFPSFFSCILLFRL